MDNRYYKPYLEKKKAYFPYTRESLLERPIFPTYVLDTGSFLCCNDLFGCAADSDAMIELIMSGKLFEYYEYDGKFDWWAVYKRFNDKNSNPQWEGHIWAARLYLLLPIAQAYCRTKDKKYADAWIKILEHWNENNPYHTYPEEGVWFDMVWYEMQLAWRTINLVHSVYLMGSEGGEALTREQWNLVYNLIKQQSDQMYNEASHYEERGRFGNHQLQVGMALIMVGALLPEIGREEDYTDVGRRVIKQNIASVYSDGVSREASISYNHFVARLYVEAELMLTVNGHEGIPGCDETIQKIFSFLHQFSAPDGKSINIGDAYTMDAKSELEFVNRVYPFSFDMKKVSKLYPAGRMAVLRNENYDLYVDAMDTLVKGKDIPPLQRTWGGGYGYHQHFGRLHFVLYGKGKKLICDLGTVNYDRSGLRIQLNTNYGHNVIACSDMPVEHSLTSTLVEEAIEVLEFTVGDDKQLLRLRNTVTDPESGNSFVWEREFHLYSDRLELVDSVKANKPMHFESNLYLPYDVDGYVDYWAKRQPISDDGRLFEIRRTDLIERIETDIPAERSFTPAVNDDNKLDVAERIRRGRFTDSFVERTIIRID